MDIQRLRNLTTGILHTDIGHVYEDIEYFIGEKGIMTHMLPRACMALQHYLKSKLEARFFDQKLDINHVGEILIDPMGAEDLILFWEKYKSMPNPIDGKKVLIVEH